MLWEVMKGLSLFQPRKGFLGEMGSTLIDVPMMFS